MRNSVSIILFLIVVTAIFGKSYVDDFTRISCDPFIESSGGAYAANGNAITASNFNPALMENSDSPMAALFSHSSAFGGLYMVDYASVNIRHNEKLNFGGSILYAGGDGIPVTALANPEDSVSRYNRPHLVEEKSHYDITLVPAVSYKLNEKFSFGLALRMFLRSHVEQTAIGGGLSAGAIYNISPQTRAGLYVRNISSMPVIWDSEHTEIAIPAPRLGLSHNFLFNQNTTLNISGDFEYLINEEVVDYGAGMRLTVYENFAISTGYSPKGFSAGASFNFMEFNIGASYTSTTNLEDSYRISFAYMLPQK